MNERARKAQDCLKAAKLLYSRFLVNAYEGNVSVRLGDTILVTPSAVCKVSWKKTTWWKWTSPAARPSPPSPGA